MSPSTEHNTWHHYEDVGRPRNSHVPMTPANRAEAARTRAELVKRECIETDAEFTKYLDDKGRISVKQLRETPKLRHLYKIYDRVSVQLCRAERRRHAPAHTPPPSPPLKAADSFDDAAMDMDEPVNQHHASLADEFSCKTDPEVVNAATMLCRLSNSPNNQYY